MDGWRQKQNVPFDHWVKTGKRRIKLGEVEGEGKERVTQEEEEGKETWMRKGSRF
jgi:antibiotic biosynthesis monooxygenase (ABM) superfamily enzyme